MAILEVFILKGLTGAKFTSVDFGRLTDEGCETGRGGKR
jgi:hypothetical protein